MEVWLIKVRTKKGILKAATAGSQAAEKSTASASNRVFSAQSSVSVTAARIAKKNHQKTIIVDPKTAVGSVGSRKRNHAWIKQLNPYFATMSPHQLVLNKA